MHSTRKKTNSGAERSGVSGKSGNSGKKSGLSGLQYSRKNKLHTDFQSSINCP
jgi:hypothetical protein